MSAAFEYKLLPIQPTINFLAACVCIRRLSHVSVGYKASSSRGRVVKAMD